MAVGETSRSSPSGIIAHTGVAGVRVVAVMEVRAVAVMEVGAMERAAMERAATERAAGRTWAATRCWKAAAEQPGCVD